MVREERKEREFNMRRAEILRQAEKIFSAKGYHNVTMADIAGASGFSVGSLYKFFKGKDDLYATMISEKLDLIYDEIVHAPDETPDIVGKIEVVVDAYLQFVEKNRDFWRLFMYGESAALSEVMEELRNKLTGDYYKHIAFIENLLASGVRAGVLRDLPVHEAAEALFHLIRASSLEWMLMPTKESLRSKRLFIVDIFLHGVKKND